MNERIVGTCLYYLDSCNITKSSLAFRAITREEENGHWSTDGDEVPWMETVFAARLRNGSLQTYGALKTPQSYMLAFPNALQRRVSPFEPADPTKPGHRHFVALTPTRASSASPTCCPSRPASTPSGRLGRRPRPRTSRRGCLARWYG